MDLARSLKSRSLFRSKIIRHIYKRDRNLETYPCGLIGFHVKLFGKALQYRGFRGWVFEGSGIAVFR